MHLINRSFLKLALLPTGLYNRMGVDTAQLKTILTTKLILDDRRPRPIAQTTTRKSKKPVSMATLGTMLMSGLMGILFLFCFWLGSDTVTHLTLYFTFFFVLLSLTLITDFTSVLIDVRDNFILLPKPVNDKTIVVARLLHIFIHLCKIVLPMSLPGAIYLGTTKNMLGGVLLFLLLFLLACFSIFFINAVYIAILKFTTPQRFQSIITYVQIVFAIVLYGGYQVFPRLLSRYTGDDFQIGNVSGILFFPLYWLANSWQVLYSFSGNATAIITAVAGIIFPLLSVVAVVKYLAPSFNRKLSMLSSNEGSPTKKAAVATNGIPGIADRLSLLITSGHTEKASFRFTWKMMSRSREFKMKVYPAIGYILVYAVFIFVSNKNISLSNLWEEDTDVKWLLLSALYLSVFLLAMASDQMVFSEKYKASWIFYTSPLAHPGQVITGAMKAVLVKFYFPVVALISTLALAFIGLQILPNLLLAVSNVVLIVVLKMYAGNHHFPFSTSQSTNAKTGSFLRSIFVFIVAGVIAFGHFLISSFWPVVVLAAGVSFAAVWYLLGSLRQLSWQKVISTYSEE